MGYFAYLAEKANEVGMEDQLSHMLSGFDKKEMFRLAAKPCGM
jgi:hypothetical protein